MFCFKPPEKVVVPLFLLKPPNSFTRLITLFFFPGNLKFQSFRLLIISFCFCFSLIYDTFTQFKKKLATITKKKIFFFFLLLLLFVYKWFYPLSFVYSSLSLGFHSFLLTIFSPNFLDFSSSSCIFFFDDDISKYFIILSITLKFTNDFSWFSPTILLICVSLLWIFFFLLLWSVYGRWWCISLAYVALFTMWNIAQLVSITVASTKWICSVGDIQGWINYFWNWLNLSSQFFFNTM